MSITTSSNGHMQKKNELYYVQITEPNSGKLRVFYLYDGILPEELTSLYQASFEKTEGVKGFSDESGVIYPPSILALKPKLFGGRKLFVLGEHSKPTTTSITPTIGVDSQGTILTEEQVQRAFDILDINSDNVIHKEEFIQACTFAYSHLLELNPGLSFAYNCVGSKNLAIVTAVNCYHSTASSQGTYFLTYDDFWAWYMSTGFNPLRDLLIKAIESFDSYPVSSDDDHHLKRVKSRRVLDVSKCYSDTKLHAFVNQMRDAFLLNKENLLTLADSFLSANGKFSALVPVRNSRNLILDSLQFTSSAGFMLNITYDILDSEATGNISISHLFSLFVLCSEEHESVLLELLFQFYSESTLQQPSQSVNDMILFNHLSVIIRMIYYFNPDYSQVTGCTPDQLSYSIYLKLLLSSELHRKLRGKLHFSEFTELYISGLELLLTILEVGGESYFDEVLFRMVTAQSNQRNKDSSTAKITRSPGKGNNVMKEEEDDDEEEDDTDDSEEENGELLRMDTNSLEDDQITSFLVGYNGAAVTIAEANELLGLNEYSTYDIVKYVIQLCNKDGLISIAHFNRGVLKLIGDHYISLTVLQRSIVDFILDAITKTFGLKNDGNNNTSEKFSLLDICIVLLLFCDDDTFTRAEIILALIKPKAIKFSLVHAVVFNLFKACYALNPTESVKEIESEAEEDARSLCVEFYHGIVAPTNNPLRSKISKKNLQQTEDSNGNATEDEIVFTNNQFLKLVNFVFITLEKESINRKLISEEGVSPGTDDDEDYNNGEGKGQNGDVSANNSLGAFSEDDESDGLHLFLDDERFPPSSTALELRAAVSVLGLEHYKADDLIDKLGSLCHVGGRLSAQGWSKWFAKVIQDANISTFDIDIAIGLGNKIFAAFQRENEDTIDYIELAVGLAFLCTRSPLEERLMVAFTIADVDSDGFLSFEEFVKLIRSTLLVLSVCSRLATKKILALETTFEELAHAAALEGIGALGILEDDEISLEMLCDLAEDYLKLAALV